LLLELTFPVGIGHHHRKIGQGPAMKARFDGTLVRWN
jgi:hypothetical protein